MKRQKILYVITKSNWGGAQRYVFDLATNLPKERFNITVAAGGNGPLFDKLNKTGIATITIPHLERDINPIKEILSLWSLFKIFCREKPDIVHLNSSKVGGLGAVAARLASLVVGRKSLVVFTAHGWAFQEPRPFWQRASIIFLSWLAALFQTRVINISKRDFDATLAWRIAPVKKTVLIPLGITPPIFLPQDKAREFLSQKIGRKILPTATLIGTVAELTKNKGLSHLLDAVKQVQCQMPNAKCQTVIIGEGEEREKLQQQIQKLGLKDTVYLAGFIPDAAQYLKAFDVFVLPSVKEGLPYTILEAIQAGVPIVATDVGGIPDVINDEKYGFLVEPANPQKLANAVLLLLKKGAATKSAIFEKDWGMTAMLKKTIEIYES